MLARPSSKLLHVWASTFPERYHTVIKRPELLKNHCLSCNWHKVILWEVLNFSYTELSGFYFHSLWDRENMPSCEKNSSAYHVTGIQCSWNIYMARKVFISLCVCHHLFMLFYLPFVIREIRKSLSSLLSFLCTGVWPNKLEWKNIHWKNKTSTILDRVIWFSFVVYCYLLKWWICPQIHAKVSLFPTVIWRKTCVSSLKMKQMSQETSTIGNTNNWKMNKTAFCPSRIEYWLIETVI